jgi:phosphate/sulfate permease
MAGRIIWAWILTIPASAAVAAAASGLTHGVIDALGGPGRRNFPT